MESRAAYIRRSGGGVPLPPDLDPEELIARQEMHPLDPRRGLPPGSAVPPDGFVRVMEATSYDCVPDDDLIAHVSNALERIEHWETLQFEPHRPVIVVAGGPSAADHVEDIRAKAVDGIVIAINGSHDWLLSHGIVPHMHVLLDPLREPAIEWVQNARDDVVYFCASIVHPDVLACLEGRRVLGWHAITGGVQEFLEKHHERTGQQIVSYGGASTAALRMLNVVSYGGGRRLEYFGLDSSYRGDAHHAYSQPIPEGADRYNVTKCWIAGRPFLCDSGMMIQCEDFRKLFWQFFPKINIVIHGDGAIPHIWREERRLRWKDMCKRVSGPR